MKAVIAHGAGDLRVEEIAEPELPAERVSVGIVYGGICGSDLHYAKNGANGAYTIAEPLTLGHEVVGVVEAVGAAVDGGPPVGTRVAIHPATPTPKPGQTDGGGLNLAVGGTYLGSASTSPHTQGGFVGLLHVTPDQLRPLPEALPLARAVLAEPLAVAIHGVSRLGDRVRGARVLVSGAGPIGSLAVAALRAAGAATIVATDLQEFPLSVARAVGADTTVQIGADAPIESESFDLAVEAAGAVPSLVTCLDAVRRGGAVLQLGMLPAGPLPVPLAGLIAKEVALFGSQRFDVELDRAIELLATTPGLDAVVSDTFGIDAASEAFDRAADSSRSAKVVIAVGPDPDRRV